ncbi:MAG: DUF547 domain-containing protein [Halobacteriovoraceae bacterium]|nr:DUF547 domain-containing protein [Halobacteriovoraceae bacterium]
MIVGKSVFYLVLFLFAANPLWSFDHTHAKFDSILKKHVRKKGSASTVDYKALRSDKKSLLIYLKTLSKVTKKQYDSFNKAQKLSFLINAYNGFTLQLIIDHYPVKSIKKIGGIFTSPWSLDFFTLLEQKTTLSHIEHEILRKDFNEPRIHFAINCASIGCPALQPYAYRADGLEKTLQRATKEFMKDGKRNFYVRKNKELHVSRIFKWFGEDFEKKHGSLESFLASHLGKNSDDKKTIREQKASLNWTDYNWDLNESVSTKGNESLRNTGSN